MPDPVRVEPVRVEADPAVTKPELEVQASAKSGEAWRLSYRALGSADAWQYLTATDPQLDGVLRRAGLRRVGAAARPAPAPAAALAV